MRAGRSGRKLNRRRADRELLDLLKEPEDGARSRVRIQSGGRDSDQVAAAAQKWAAGLDPMDPNHEEHNMLEALWIHQYHNVVNVDLLKRTP